MEKILSVLGYILGVFSRPPRKEEVSGCPVSSWDRGLYILRGHFWDTVSKLNRVAKGSNSALRELVEGKQGKGGLPRLKREAGLVPSPLKGAHKALCKALVSLSKAQTEKAKQKALESATKAVLEAFRVALGDPAFGPVEARTKETQETAETHG